MTDANNFNYLVNNDDYDEKIYVTSAKIDWVEDEDGVETYGFKFWNGSNHQFSTCGEFKEYQELNRADSKKYVEILNAAIINDEWEKETYGKYAEVGDYTISISYLASDFPNYTITKMNEDDDY